jgi:hypothetical protein
MPRKKTSTIAGNLLPEDKMPNIPYSNMRTLEEINSSTPTAAELMSVANYA